MLIVQQPWVFFPTKNGSFLGVPPFKETSIYESKIIKEPDDELCKNFGILLLFPFSLDCLAPPQTLSGRL